ncbi:MAG: YdeI/OmpD-associated family protein [Bacteroidetes bacterium]|nr:YdeI/OmpD-associated family protein [Bacteroidota bacterium]
MPHNLAQKLRMKEGMKLLSVNAPADGFSHLRSLLKNVQISATIKEYDQVHWFVKNKSAMEKELKKILALLKPGIVCWIYYPKGSSSIQTDLTRDKGWEKLLEHKELQWLSLISFDDTWSAFGMRLKTDADEKKETKSAVRLIFDYVDPVKKTVKLPDDLAAALKKSKTASAYFETLSFTNKKEYVEWIITAKREETRNERLKGTIERLNKKWKNPRNL